MRTAVIMLAGNMQQECFWPSYNYCNSGYAHDLIVVHRNGMCLPPLDSIKNSSVGPVIFENKISHNGEDIPHRAFGAYRHYFNKFKNDYDCFVFISDDVVLKRDGWLKKIIDALSFHENLGFGASQIFNEGKAYPHESHLRAPFWFAKTRALKSIDWEFSHDHDGEMRIGNQLTEAGFFGIQVGNKIDLGFDSCEHEHITQILEKSFFNKNPFGKYENEELDFFEKQYALLTEDEIKNKFIFFFL